MSRSYAIKNWSDIDRSFRVVATTPAPVLNTEPGPDGKDVEFLEILEGWDFTRFQKNPLFLENHNDETLDSALGHVSEIELTPGGGFTAKVTLSPESPRAKELEPRIKSGLIRGVSVSGDYGQRTDEIRNGKPVRVFRNNVLNELSLCLVPADEDALVETEADPEEQKRERISNAGRLLREGRVLRTDAAEGEVDRFDFIGNTSKFTRTQTGGIRVPARLTRTGVLEYRRPDGTIRRELRLPEEVFHDDSLATLAGATVTDLAHHNGLLDSSNWKEATLGHTENARQDGNFIAADLVINDPVAVADIENGRLHDISLGYRCRLDAEPGEWEGQRYDVVQRRIRNNHVAVLPKGRGRAGTDVALRLDSEKNSCDSAEYEEAPMADPVVPIIQTKTLIHLDGKDLEYGSKDHIAVLEAAHLKDLERFDAEKTVLATEKQGLIERCDKADGAKAVAEKKSADLEEEKKGESARSKERMRRRLKLIRSAMRLMAEDDDEEKTDAHLDSLDEKSDREIMVDVIHADARWKDEKFDDADGKPIRGDEYVQAIFDSVVREFKRSDGVDSVVTTIETVKRTDKGDADPADAARAAGHKAFAEAWKQPVH